MIAQNPTIRIVEFQTIIASACETGDYAWVLINEGKSWGSRSKQKRTFQYLNRDGKVLWEKRGIINATLSDDGKVVLLAEGDTEKLETEHASDSIPYFAKVYDLTGREILKVKEGELQTERSFKLTRNGKYGYVDILVDGEVESNEKGQPYRPKIHNMVFFDIQHNKKFIWDEKPGLQGEIDEDGTFKVVEVKLWSEPGPRKPIKRITKDVFSSKF